MNRQEFVAALERKFDIRYTALCDPHTVFFRRLRRRCVGGFAHGLGYDPAHPALRQRRDIGRKRERAVAERALRAAESHFEPFHGRRRRELKLGIGQRALNIVCLIFARAVRYIELRSKARRQIRR